MAKLRNKKGQFVRGHHKVAKKHHRRRNPAPIGAMRLARGVRKSGRSRDGPAARPLKKMFSNLGRSGARRTSARRM